MPCCPLNQKLVHSQGCQLGVVYVVLLTAAYSDPAKAVRGLNRLLAGSLWISDRVLEGKGGQQSRITLQAFDIHVRLNDKGST
jgi:hypothetical protein